MEKIKKYIDNFMKKVGTSSRYDLTFKETMAFFKAVKGTNPIDAINDLFLFGYAKGYRACKAEQKKAQEV